MKLFPVCCLFLLAIFVTGCGKNDPPETRELSTDECRQLEEKQVALMAEELPEEYRDSFKDGSYKMDPPCSSLKEKGRARYTCTMSASSMKDLEQCLSGA